MFFIFYIIYNKNKLIRTNNNVSFLKMKINNLFRIINNITADSRLTNSCVRVFLGLLSFNGKGKIFPSIKQLQQKTTIKSELNVSRSLQRLEDCGYIKITRRPNSSNVYEILEYMPEEITYNILELTPESVERKPLNKNRLIKVN